LPSKGPMGLQMMGVTGPMKLIIDILETEDESTFFVEADLRIINDINRRLQPQLISYGIRDNESAEVSKSQAEVIQYFYRVAYPLSLHPT
jgi:hypothetical protein